MWSVDCDIAARKAFASRLNVEIKRQKLSHRRLATLVETSKQSVTNWTQGRNEPSLRYVRRLSSVLGVPVSRLLDAETGSNGAEATAIVDELARLQLHSPIVSLSESSAAFLDLLARAEQEARKKEGA